MGKTHGIYLLAGEERYLKEEFLRILKSDIFGRESGNIDFEQFSPADSSAGEIIALAKTLPFSSHQRLIVVQDPEKFSPREKEAFAAFLENPPSSACVVLDTQEKSLSDSFFKSLPKNVQVKRFDRLKPADLRKWILQEVKKRDLKINADALTALEELAGNDLSALNSALEKISLYARTKKDAVTRESVEELCDAVSEKSGFELIEAVKRKDAGAALKILDALVSKGKRHAEVMGLLIWHLGRLAAARRLIRKGASREDIASETKVPLFMIDEFIRQVRALGDEKLREGLAGLIDAESAIKTGSIQEKIAVELCVLKLARLGL